MKIKIILLYLMFLCYSFVYGQNLGHGDPLNRAKNTLAGNQVRLTFFNWGAVGTQTNGSPTDYPGEFPIGTGETQLGSAEPFVASEVQVGDSLGQPIYVTPAIWSQGWDPNLFPHSLTGQNWGFEPLPGFINETQKQNDPNHDSPMASEPYTWPSFWPDKMTDPNDPGWPGHWDGFFGKDQKNADEESYFVVDDYMYHQGFGKYSLPMADSTDPSRGGLGLRMYVRGLQWSNPDAADVIFWLFSIQNIGDIQLPRTVFGFNVGSSNGDKIGCTGNQNNQAGAIYWRKPYELAANYLITNVGCGGYSPVPWVGYSYLESPGNPYDGIDNDADGDSPNTPGGGEGHIITTGDFTRTIIAGQDKIVLIDYNDPGYKRTVEVAPEDSIVINYRGQMIVYKPINVNGKKEYILTEDPYNGMDDNLNGLIDENDGVVNSDGSKFYLYLRSSQNNSDYLSKDYLSTDSTTNGMKNLMIDERRDDGIDNNGNWDPKFDDVGLDGKPGTGDYGEADGRPTSGWQPKDVVPLPSSAKPNDLGLYDTGLPGEPDIDKTDIQESDQIGLTSFKFYIYGSVTYSNFQQMWQFSQPGTFDVTSANTPGDHDYIFSSGFFPLLTGQTNFFSVALIFGIDSTQLLRNKNTVQTIYNANYNFATAPNLPIVKAVAGDHKVTLTWDDGAEKSFDRFLHTYDFEGYKIYRGTYQFLDAGSITDGYGYQKYLKPIAIYDKIDGISGFFPKDIGGSGVLFNLGNESGLTHSFVDTNLVNGVRYFYAITAYTSGDASKNIGPAETSMMVLINQSGQVTQLGSNVVVATPQAPAAGYQPAGFEINPSQENNTKTTATVGVNILDPDSLVNGDEYEIHFLDQSMDNHFNGLTPVDDPSRLLPSVTTGFTLTNLTQNIKYDTVWFYQYAKTIDTTSGIDSTVIDTLQNLYNDNDGNPRTLSKIIDGMRIFVYNPPDNPGIYNNPEEGINNGMQPIGNIADTSLSGIGFKLFNLLGFQSGTLYPRDYRIVFYDSLVSTSSSVDIHLINRTTGQILPSKATLKAVPTNFKVFDYDTGEEVPYGFYDVTPKNSSIVKPGFFSAGDYIVMFEKLKLANGQDSTLITWKVTNGSPSDSLFYQQYNKLIGYGDTLNLFTNMELTSSAKYKFVVSGQKINMQLAKTSLNAIKVVPNPYVVTSLFDPYNPYTTSGTGTRLVQFIHLPQQCTIKIYTVDGSLVRTINHNASMRDGSESWNLLNRDNMEVAYGVYIYVVDAPGIGQNIGKIMLIK